MEKLGRGVVAVRKSTSEVYISWRLLGTDPSGIGFNLYRDATKLNSTPITASTNYVDAVSTNGIYTVKPVIDGIEQAASAGASVWAQQWLEVPLQIPPGGTSPDGIAYTYSPNDTSPADLDGDGEYELVVLWNPSNAKDNSQSGYTGNAIIDGYKIDGTRLWRIDLGINIRAGAHYTQLMAYDLDGDGKAEVAVKTADGTKSGTGQVIGSATADYRNSSGYILSGPEFLTVFNGQTGAAMATTDFIPARGTVSSWGDTYGNRVDRFISTIAYVDGARPSLIMGRGYYTRMVRVAWDWRNGALTQKWVFDSNTTGNSAYYGQGNHQLSVADGDGDGKDDIYNGSSTISGTGAGLYSNGMGHGDALHVSDMDPNRPGQEVWMCYETMTSSGNVGLALTDAKTGAKIWTIPASADVGRGTAADVDPRFDGFEMWGSVGGLYTSTGTEISTTKPIPNHLVWWDGDVQREVLNGDVLDKWNPATNSTTRLYTLYNFGGATYINGTKRNPNVSADILGDWREEIVLRSSDNSKLLIFTTVTPASNRFYTFMHDPQYRCQVAGQPSAYNQPPHTSFYFGGGMVAPPTPNIYLAGISISPAAPTGLTATAGDSKVDLSWTASSGASSYNVKRSTTSGGPYTNIITGLTTTSYSNTGLANGTTYYYVVSAVNSAGESANSTQASATPQGTAPAAPTGLTATAGDSKVDLSWTASSGASSYNVKRSTTSGGPYTNIITGLTTTSYSNTGLTNGTTYYYVVSAVNSAGESANSGEVSATPTGGTTSTVLQENITGGSAAAVKKNQTGAQSFKNGTAGETAYYIKKIVLHLSTDAQLPNANFLVNIGTGRNSGAITASSVSISPSTITNNTAGSSFMTYTITYSTPVGPLTAGTTYYINMSCQAGNGKAVYVDISSSDTYANGIYYQSSSNTGKDMWFQLWGGTSSTTMSLNSADMLLLSDIVQEGSKTTVYPNPVIGSSFFVNPGADLINQNVTVKVTDMSGRLIFSKNFVRAASQMEIELPASVATGIYNVSVNGYVSKLMIQK